MEVSRKWSGYCRGTDTVEVEVTEGMTAEQIIEAAEELFDEQCHREVVRDDRNVEEWYYE